MNQLRSAFFKAVSKDDIAAVVRKVVEAAKGGDLGAAALLFQYAIGKPQAAEDRGTASVQMYVFQPHDFGRLDGDDRRVVENDAKLNGAFSAQTPSTR